MRNWKEKVLIQKSRFETESLRMNWILGKQAIKKGIRIMWKIYKKNCEKADLVHRTMGTHHKSHGILFIISISLTKIKSIRVNRKLSPCLFS